MEEEKEETRKDLHQCWTRAEKKQECALEEGDAIEDLHQYLLRTEYGMCAGGPRETPEMIYINKM